MSVEKGVSPLYDMSVVEYNCKCKKNCFSNIGETERQSILNNFNSLTCDKKKSYLRNKIEVLPISTDNIINRRSATYRYWVQINRNNVDINLKVCFSAFILLHDVSRRFIKNIQNDIRSESKTRNWKDNISIQTLNNINTLMSANAVKKCVYITLYKLFKSAYPDACISLKMFKLVCKERGYVKIKRKRVNDGLKGDRLPAEPTPIVQKSTTEIVLDDLSLSSDAEDGSAKSLNEINDIEEDVASDNVDKSSTIVEEILSQNCEVNFELLCRAIKEERFDRSDFITLKSAFTEKRRLDPCEVCNEYFVNEFFYNGILAGTKDDREKRYITNRLTTLQALQIRHVINILVFYRQRCIWEVFNDICVVVNCKKHAPSLDNNYTLYTCSVRIFERFAPSYEFIYYKEDNINMNDVICVSLNYAFENYVFRSSAIKHIQLLIESDDALNKNWNIFRFIYHVVTLKDNPIKSVNLRYATEGHSYLERRELLDYLNMGESPMIITRLCNEQRTLSLKIPESLVKAHEPYQPNEDMPIVLSKNKEIIHDFTSMLDEIYLKDYCLPKSSMDFADVSYVRANTQNSGTILVCSTADGYGYDCAITEDRLCEMPCHVPSFLDLFEPREGIEKWYNEKGRRLEWE